jgi:uncharacterized membrane protein YhaH (DUF805 family)
MDALTLFASTEGRLARKPFWLSVVAIYLAGFAAQLLLVPQVTARGGVWAFAFAQAALIWAWLAVHIKRLRDAGQGPAGAIGVAAIYALGIVLLLMLIAFLTNPNAPGAPSGEPANEGSGLALLLVIVILGLLFSPDFGAFMTILKLIVLIACLPAIISLVFSIVTGTRRSIAP